MKSEYACPICENAVVAPQLPEEEEGVTFSCPNCGNAISAVHFGQGKIDIVDDVLYSGPAEA